MSELIQMVIYMVDLVAKIQLSLSVQAKCDKNRVALKEKEKQLNEKSQEEFLLEQRRKQD